ncbi:NAD(P)-binding protein [Aspergillus undulatus]|uniref:NAD(P)-binding protein n=1 Tax=Aspergillus undulatus TaxID=1810928 RepID=UPI003CCCE21B
MTTRYETAHESTEGHSDTHPTALQLICEGGLECQLADKSILITGASAGIGLETAKALFTSGATLYLTARDLEKARHALGEEMVNSPRVRLLQLDLADLDSVRACAITFLELSETGKLNIFVANAGVMASPETHTKDGFETHFGVNYLAHFLLFVLLRPSLLAAARASNSDSRAIFLTSIAHRYAELNLDDPNFEKTPHNKFAAYSASKTGLIWLSNEINRRYASQGLRSFAVEPGMMWTGLHRHLSEEEKSGIAADLGLKGRMRSTQQGAAAVVWAALSAGLEGEGGKYLEDCKVGELWDSREGMWAPGYAEHAFDKEKERKLWDLSVELVRFHEPEE